MKFEGFIDWFSWLPLVMFPDDTRGTRDHFPVSMNRQISEIQRYKRAEYFETVGENHDKSRVHFSTLTTDCEKTMSDEFQM